MEIDYLDQIMVRGVNKNIFIHAQAVIQRR